MFDPVPSHSEFAGIAAGQLQKSGDQVAPGCAHVLEELTWMMDSLQTLACKPASQGWQLGVKIYNAYRCMQWNTYSHNSGFQASQGHHSGCCS